MRAQAKFSKRILLSGNYPISLVVSILQKCTVFTGALILISWRLVTKTRTPGTAQKSKQFRQGRQVKCTKHCSARTPLQLSSFWVLLHFCLLHFDGRVHKVRDTALFTQTEHGVTSSTEHWDRSRVERMHNSPPSKGDYHLLDSTTLLFRQQKLP